MRPQEQLPSDAIKAAERVAAAERRRAIREHNAQIADHLIAEMQGSVDQVFDAFLNVVERKFNIETHYSWAHRHAVSRAH